MDCSPKCSSVHGISQARIVERVAISYSGGYSQPRDGTQVSQVLCIDRQILYHCITILKIKCNPNKNSSRNFCYAQIEKWILNFIQGNSLAMQWLELCTSIAKGTGSIPAQRTKILYAKQPNKLHMERQRTKNGHNNLDKESTRSTQP